MRSIPTVIRHVHRVPSGFHDSFRVAISSAFGLGLSPLAPGSCGALLGVLIHVAILRYSSPGIVLLLLILCLTLVSIANWLLTPFAVRYWREADPQHFVLDEVAGYLVVAVVCPFMTEWYSVAAGFLLFRAFDIIKVPPARQIDRDWTGAAGILLDDIVSGLYAGGTLWTLWILAKSAGLRQ